MSLIKVLQDLSRFFCPIVSGQISLRINSTSCTPCFGAGLWCGEIGVPTEFSRSFTIRNSSFNSSDFLFLHFLVYFHRVHIHTVLLFWKYFIHESCLSIPGFSNSAPAEFLKILKCQKLCNWCKQSHLQGFAGMCLQSVDVCSKSVCLDVRVVQSLFCLVLW